MRDSEMLILCCGYTSRVVDVALKNYQRPSKFNKGHFKAIISIYGSEAKLDLDVVIGLENSGQKIMFKNRN